jgi:DNA repair protein RadC
LLTTRPETAATKKSRRVTNMNNSLGLPVIGVRLVRDGAAPLPVARCVNQPAVAAAAFAKLLADRDRETVAALLLATNHRPLGIHVVSVGTLDSAPVHPREVFKAAVLANAASLIIAHNHPSGDPTPSRADHQILHRLARAGALLGIPVLDYIIVGAGGAYWSAREGGCMPTTSGPAWTYQP